MDPSKIGRRTMLIAVLVMSIAVSFAACDSAPAPASDPAPAPSPTSEPELSLDELLQSAGEKLAAITTAKFTMVDEMESGKEFFGQKLKAVDGEVRSPDGARMLVDVESASFGFVQIEIVAVEEQAYMKFSKDAPWLPLALEDVPFNFGGIGVILSDLLPIMENTAIVGRESVGDSQTIRVDGNVMSEDMSGLISDVNSGHALTLTYWFDEAEHTMRQFRIKGKLYNEDAPETSRLVKMDINVPVDIQLPDIAS